MSGRRSKDVAANEIDELFEGIGDESTPPKKASKSKEASKSKAAAAAATKKASAAAAAASAAATTAAEKDILAELENELEDKPASRPHTPRLKEIASPPLAKGSPGRRAAAAGTSGATPPLDGAAFPRRSAEGAKPSASAPAPAAASGGSWWGGLLSTATAAMKQAEEAVKEIQQNEEAKKWAEQVRGNYSTLRGYGDELRHRALPAFTDILHTLAPPIASHEQLLIHITHDMVGYPSLDPLVHGVFSRVMAQVEGGDLLVIQRGQENAVRSSSSSDRKFLGVTGVGYLASAAAGSASAGWRDGPWWRAVDSPRDLGAVPGLHEGTKLCRASAEAYSNEYYAATGGLEGARQRAVEPMSESNPVRRSDLFLAVQAILTTAKTGGNGNDRDVLFAGSARSTKKAPKKAESDDDDDSDDSDDSEESEESEEDDDDEEADTAEEMVCFAVYVLDPVHEILYHTVSQEFPSKWVRWLDAPASLTPTSSIDGADLSGASSLYDRVPDDIREIVESGGVDPREWVAEWVEETLTLAVGVVAQRYVARRMGVGLGSIGKGKRREDVILEDGAGEAARAV